MPKLTDHPKLKQSIAEAAWRVMLQQGMQKMSARNIAKEAGLTLGAMRYYFSSQEELLDYANQLVHARLAEKIDEIFQDDLQPKVKILRVLLSLFPTDTNSVLEAKVRVTMKILSTKKDAAEKVETDAAYAAVKNIISYLALLNLIDKEADLAIETDRLYALIDGIALGLFLRPETADPKKTEKLIMYHLNSICIDNFGVLK